MTKYYSKSTGGFYAPEINDTMPPDVLEITDQKWMELLDGQSKGQIIKADADGYPILVDAPTAPPTKVLTLEEKLTSVGLTLAELREALR